MARKAVLFSLFLSLALSSFAQGTTETNQPQIPIVVDGDEVSYDAEARSIQAKGDVKIAYQGIQVSCDRALVDTLTSIGRLSGNVRIDHEDGTIYGDSIVYDFVAKTAEINQMKLTAEPFYAYAKSSGKISDNEYHLTEGYVTTCDLDEPHYRLCAKKIEFYPGDKVVARNVILKVGKIPVFWIPYYLQPSKDKLPRVTLVPGKDEDMGFFMRSAWRYYFSESFKGRLHLDWYENKGFGRGITHKYNTKEFGEGILKLYYIDDKDGVSFDGRDTRGSDRYKAQFRHDWQVSPDVNAVMEFHKFSDNDFMKDYFNTEYLRDARPETYLQVNYSFQDAALSLYAQKNVNDFWSETEYLPMLRFEAFRRRLGNSNFYFDGRYSAANLNLENASPSSLDSDVIRVNLDNVLTYQKRLGWLNVAPYVRANETYYSKNMFGDEDIFRMAFSSGIELYTKLYKSLGPIDFMGVQADDLRHIVTPIIQYDYAHSPTVSAGVLQQFDTLDALTGQNRVAFTLQNKVQAKFEGKTRDLLYFAPTVDYLIDDDSGSHFNELSYDLEYRPFKDIYLEQDFSYDLDNNFVSEVTTDFIIKDALYRLGVGHRYVRDESSQITSSFSYKLTPKWELRSYVRFEAETGDWKRQQYYLRRDLHCWFADFGIDIDEGEDYTFWVIFRIKAFPDMGIEFTQSYEPPQED